jgi:1,4-dihydroxy-2-naphthoate octaprenyltransferase
MNLSYLILLIRKNTKSNSFNPILFGKPLSIVRSGAITQLLLVFIICLFLWIFAFWSIGKLL